MASKSANVIARVEPEVKEAAENVLEQLGIPVSVVINMLYRQIAMTQSIPFSLTLPTAPKAREDMDEMDFHAFMARGYADSVDGKTNPADEILDRMLKEFS